MSQPLPPESGLGPDDFASPFGDPQEQRPRDPRSQRPTNAWAIASLVSGLLGCVPFATGIIAIITGIIGLRRANDPRYGGRPLAVGGLALGVMSVLFWLFFGGTFLGVFRATGEPRKLAQEVVRMASDGAVDAMEETASGIGRPELELLVAQMEPWGEYQDLTSYSSSINVAATVTRCHLQGSATFANGEHPFTMTLVKQGDDWKVSALEFE